MQKKFNRTKKMREKQNNWQRVEAVIKWANMSTNYFARYIGLARGENLYQIKRGNNGISLDVAERVVAKFPQIDKLWLLTGEGQMFCDSSLRGVQIPYYNVDVEQSIARLGELESNVSFMAQPVGDCDLAMPGSEYVIITQKIVTLRIVRTADEEGKLRLVAGDRRKFDDILLPASEIKALYKVKGILIINS